MDQLKSLFVDDPWLTQILLGNKLVEGRKGPKSKYEEWIGKDVIFYNNSIKILVHVEAVRHYNTLYDYLNFEGLEKVAPHITTGYDAVVDAYHKFGSDEEIGHGGGFNSIVIKLY